MTNNLIFALSRYESIKTIYDEFIANNLDSLNKIKGLHVQKLEDSNFQLTALNKKIECEFSFKSDDGNYYGVMIFSMITTLNDIKQGELLREFWIDHLGNIHHGSGNGYAKYSVSNDGALDYCVTEVLEELVLKI
ncbi:hypothetical protein SH16_01430 [Aeromonas caviae]|uniref:hypothetical protein n=1 Tax=Aeromonas caviae TaxID=648 RepID=UPI00065861B8|nr:hypothetical protein [Aeromonas caviae]KLV47697.1 hypothetical protein SH16_01430 [Aeromonas caviae]